MKGNGMNERQAMQTLNAVITSKVGRSTSEGRSRRGLSIARRYKYVLGCDCPPTSAPRSEEPMRTSTSAAERWLENTRDERPSVEHVSGAREGQKVEERPVASGEVQSFGAVAEDLIGRCAGISD